MKKEHLYEPYEIVSKIIDHCPKLEHQHTFFELVFIISGTGKQCINQHKFDYKQGHMFLLTPQDCHSFDIETTTHFFFLRFNDSYVKSRALHSDNIKQMEFILENANHNPGCILKNHSDKSLMYPIIEAIIRETQNRDIYDREITQQLVNTLIVIVARNIAKYLPVVITENSEEKVVNILTYIQNNIYYPEKIRADVIGEYFGISENYLGKYFKKHCHETMQSYINNSRLSLIEHRLKHSNKRMNEIVTELGFTDESHLNKFFKRQNGMSPKQFRFSTRSV